MVALIGDGKPNVVGEKPGKFTTVNKGVKLCAAVTCTYCRTRLSMAVVYGFVIPLPPFAAAHGFAAPAAGQVGRGLGVELSTQVQKRLTQLFPAAQLNALRASR